MDMTLDAQKARRNYKRQYRSRNRDKINAQQRAWNARNPDKIKEYQRKAGIPGEKRGVYCMARKDGMNDRQRAFADYFIECGNATEAARRAGYSEKTARFIGAENLTKPHILEYIKQRAIPTEQKRIASADSVLQFFTRVMNGEEEGAKIPDRICAGKEILKRDIDGKKLEIELLKLESQVKDNQPEEDAEDNFLDALNAVADDVWEDSQEKE